MEVIGLFTGKLSKLSKNKYSLQKIGKGIELFCPINSFVIFEKNKIKLYEDNKTKTLLITIIFSGKIKHTGNGRRSASSTLCTTEDILNNVKIEFCELFELWKNSNLLMESKTPIKNLSYYKITHGLFEFCFDVMDSILGKSIKLPETKNFGLGKYTIMIELFIQDSTVGKYLNNKKPQSLEYVLFQCIHKSAFYDKNATPLLQFNQLKDVKIKITLLYGFKPMINFEEYKNIHGIKTDSGMYYFPGSVINLKKVDIRKTQLFLTISKEVYYRKYN